jgi:transposase
MCRMSNFRLIDRDTGFLMPPLVDEWLPERHLARFVVEVVGGLDLRAMTGSYRGSGEASYHPQMLLGLVIYGYATGVFSSRKLERASYDSVAFRFMAANEHPDHDTIAAFRRRFLKQIETLFVQVLGVAREMGVLKMGTVALDGTKIHANASRHSALSYERRSGAVDQGCDARPAGLLRERHCSRSRRRARRPHAILVIRPDRRAEHQAEAREATDVRPSEAGPSSCTPARPHIIWANYLHQVCARAPRSAPIHRDAGARRQAAKPYFGPQQAGNRLVEGRGGGGECPARLPDPPLCRCPCQADRTDRRTGNAIAAR